MNKTIIILVGIPCSGKSRWAVQNKFLTYDPDAYLVVVSRDDIRENYFSKPYKFSLDSEDRVTRIFNSELTGHLNYVRSNPIVLDNTHCKEKYIDEIIFKYEGIVDIRVKFFDCPLWKAMIRNIVRRIVTKNPYKWIPWVIMKNMKKNYDKINRKKYEQYVV